MAAREWPWFSGDLVVVNRVDGSAMRGILIEERKGKLLLGSSVDDRLTLLEPDPEGELVATEMAGELMVPAGSYKFVQRPG